MNDVAVRGVTTAGELAEVARVLGQAGIGLEAAADWAGPRVDKAWKRTVAVTAPKVEEATERVRPAVDDAYERLTEDYLPRVQKAMHDAAQAASGGNGISQKAGKAGAAAKEALSKPPKKSRGVAKTLGWVVVGTVAAGAGYLLWRRSQPLDDPWAEEYWNDSAAPAPTSGQSATDKISHAAATAKDRATEAAGKVSETVKEKAEDVKEKAAETREQAAQSGDETKAKAAGAAGTAAETAQAKADEAKDAADKRSPGSSSESGGTTSSS